MTTVGVEHHLMFIGGQPVDSEDQFEILSPATGEVICTMAKGTVDHVDQAVASAREAFDSGVWSRKAPDERSAVMKAIVERMGEEMEEFVDAEISCNGATRRQAYGFHVGYAAPHFLHFAEEAASFTFEEAIPTVAYPTSSYNKVLHEPLGVCAAIVPWNFPLLLGIWKIGPALAAGNSIVVKVDEKTPLSLLRLAQVAYECGVPAGVFNVVSGDGVEVGARLASHPDVDKVAFTGSTPVGREIMRLASGTVKKVSLELGGKGPVIVMPDADQRIAADGALFGCILYSGQICLSGTRILVHDSIYDEFVDRLIARAKTLKVGDPDDLDTDLGPVISARQQKRILDYIESGKAEGATLALGGGVPEGHQDHGFWVEPTIFTDVTNDMKIAREEIFGPVMSVLRFSTPAEAIAIANDTDYGLTAGIWSTDLEEAQEMATKLEAGTVWINNWHMLDPKLPFGGYKQSGVGRELGPTALEEYTQTKHVHVDLTTNLERHIFDALLSTPPED